MLDGPRPLAAAATSIVPLLAGAIQATPDAVGNIQHAVASFARTHGADGAALALIGPAVHDAVTSVVDGEWPPGAEGLVHVTADIDEGTLDIVISDDAREETEVSMRFLLPA